MITDRIYCFYTDWGAPGEKALVDFWVDRWKVQGWKPEVLSPTTMLNDARLPALTAKAKSFPCLNAQKFQVANCTRWLAFATIDGAVADYDVLPIKPFPPADYGGFVCFDPCGGPGLIIGSKQNFSKIADDIMAYEPRSTDLTWNKPHVSDMIILQNTKARYDTILNQHRCYGVEGWRDVPLCHFGNAYLQPYGKVGRLAQIKAALATCV